MKKKGKRLTGANAMRAKGMHCSQLWYTPEDFDLLQRAAQIDRRPMTVFTILATLAEARRVLSLHLKEIQE